MKTSTEIIAEMQKIGKLRDNYNNVQNEGATDGFNPHEDQLGKLSDELKIARQKEADEEWTEEVTEERRHLWNAEVKKISGNFNGQDILAIQEKLGFRMDTLKSYIAKHA